MKRGLLLLFLINLLLALQASALSCSQCTARTESGCSDNPQSCLWGDYCFRATGRLWDGSQFVNGFIKGCAPCDTNEQACNFLNRTGVKMVFSDGYLVTCNLKCCQSDNCNMGGEFPTASTNPLASSSPPHSNPQTMPLTTVAITPSPDRSTPTEPDSTLTTPGGTGPVTDSSTHRASSANPSTPSSSPADTNSPALLVITIMCGSLLIALLNGGR